MPEAVNPDEADPGDKRPMSAIYVRVVVIEAAVITALWLFGRMFR
jgi:hypothetical protein